MAFLDDLSKKTKNLSEIAKCNSAIAEDERNCNNTLLLIGRKYAELHANDGDHAPEEFRPLLYALRQAQMRIAENKRRIEDLKGLVRCPACGAAMEPESLFCTNCGAQMPRPQPQTAPNTPSFCAHCGAKLHPESKFCTSCGTPVPPQQAPAPTPGPIPAPGPAPAHEPAPAPGPAPAPEPTPVPGPAPAHEPAPAPEPTPVPEPTAAPSQRLCPNCGKPAPEGTRFCTKCGTKLA